MVILKPKAITWVSGAQFTEMLGNGNFAPELTFQRRAEERNGRKQCTGGHSLA